MPIEKSGSCAMVLITLDDKIYSVNVGDSRTFISLNKGKNFENLTEDHKPGLKSE